MSNVLNRLLVVSSTDKFFLTNDVKVGDTIVREITFNIVKDDLVHWDHATEQEVINQPAKEVRVDIRLYVDAVSTDEQQGYTRTYFQAVEKYMPESYNPVPDCCHKVYTGKVVRLELSSYTEYEMKDEDLGKGKEKLGKLVMQTKYPVVDVCGEAVV